MSTPAQADVESRRQETRGLASVQHPADLGAFYLSMDFYDYRAAIGSTSSAHNPENAIDPVRRLYNADRQSVNSQIQRKNTFAKIKLPIPSHLNDSYRSVWEESSLGGFAGIAGDVYSAANALITSTDGGAEASAEMAGALSAAAKSAVVGIGRQLITNTPIGDIYDLFTGTAMNQNLAVLFRGPTLKSHQFRWRVAPRNAQESADIKKIIAILKRAQHATQLSPSSSSVLRYPSECLLQFHSAGDNTKFLYPMRPCVLEQLDINHSPNGSLSLHQETFDASIIDISCTFKETSYYTRESFDNQNEYGYDGYSTADLTRGAEGIAYGSASEVAPTPASDEDLARLSERVITDPADTTPVTVADMEALING